MQGLGLHRSDAAIFLKKIGRLDVEAVDRVRRAGGDLHLVGGTLSKGFGEAGRGFQDRVLREELGSVLERRKRRNRWAQP